MLAPSAVCHDQAYVVEGQRPVLWELFLQKEGREKYQHRVQ